MKLKKKHENTIFNTIVIAIQLTTAFRLYGFRRLIKTRIYRQRGGGGAFRWFERCSNPRRTSLEFQVIKFQIANSATAVSHVSTSIGSVNEHSAQSDSAADSPCPICSYLSTGCFTLLLFTVRGIFDVLLRVKNKTKNSEQIGLQTLKKKK